ncbi:MAG: hypothetical protein ABIJ34_04665 [archaeon]
MKNQIFLGLVISLFLTGCINVTVESDATVLIDKSKNMCSADSDCEFVSFAGGCNTPQYIEKIMNACRDKTGPCPGEAPPRDPVLCKCENYACVEIE